MLKLFWSLIVLHFLSFSQLIVLSPLSLSTSRPLPLSPPPLSLSLSFSACEACDVHLTSRLE